VSLAGKTRLCATSPKREQQELIVMTVVREGCTIRQIRVEMILNSQKKRITSSKINKETKPSEKRTNNKPKERRITLPLTHKFPLAPPLDLICHSKYWHKRVSLAGKKKASLHKSKTRTLRTDCTDCCT
jgi:hypothetical protein